MELPGAVHPIKGLVLASHLSLSGMFSALLSVVIQFGVFGATLLIFLETELERDKKGTRSFGLGCQFQQMGLFFAPGFHRSWNFRSLNRGRTGWLPGVL